MQDRNRIPYTPGESAINTVRVIVMEAGYPDPTPHQVNGAYIELGARDGLTVGEVAEQLVASQHGGQAKLF